MKIRRNVSMAVTESRRIAALPWPGCNTTTPPCPSRAEAKMRKQKITAIITLGLLGLILWGDTRSQGIDAFAQMCPFLHFSSKSWITWSGEAMLQTPLYFSQAYIPSPSLHITQTRHTCCTFSFLYFSPFQHLLAPQCLYVL